MATLYQTDYLAWLGEQAAALRAGRLERVDADHLAEELEAMSGRERRELTSRLRILLAHLLKYRHQPALRSKSWVVTIRVQRRDIRRLLDDMPSLRAMAPKMLEDAYVDGRDLAALETSLDEALFPAMCPWTLDQILDTDYLPEG